MPYVNNDGIRIYFEITGSGAPLILQHGLSDSIAGWRESGLVEWLQDRHRLIMIDARGHGRSDKPHDPAAYELKQRVGDVLAVLDTLDISRAGYYGYSMGGWIGYGLAQHSPERLTTLVIGGAHPYTASTELFRQIFAGGIMPWLDLLEKMAGPLSFITRERILSNDVDALRASVAQDRPDVAAGLADFTLSCRLLSGSADLDYGLIERCAHKLPNARFFPLAGLNHFQAYVRSDLVAPIILSELIPLAVEQT